MQEAQTPTIELVFRCKMFDNVFSAIVSLRMEKTQAQRTSGTPFTGRFV